MFIYSLRASTLKFFGVVCVALVALITLIAFVPTYSVEDSGQVSADVKATYHYDKIKDNEARLEFINQFGWTVNPTPTEEVEVSVPEEFDKVFAGYNEIQRRQGLDLAKYKNKRVMRYTYEVTNYPGYTGKVYLNMLVYRNRVIGGDVCSADVNGFIHGFESEAKKAP